MTSRQHGLHAVDNSTLPFNEGGNAKAAWSAYRFRRNLALFLLFGWVPVATATFLVSRLWLHQPLASLAVIILWWIAASVAIWWAGEFRCPRCRRRYGALGSKRGFGMIWRGLFDEICNNCKLRKFENFSAEGSNPGSMDRRVAKS